MKLLILSISILCSCFLHAQGFTYPKLPISGKSLHDFVLPNWFLKDSAGGDLNGDQLIDQAIVLEYKDTIQEQRPDGTVNEGSPRVLAVLLKNAKTGGYDLFVQNNTFITRYGEGGMDPDAYGEVSISKGILQIYVSFIRGSATYKFRMQNGDLFLIGGTTGGVSGGMFYGFDVNFSTRKAKIEEGRIDEEKKKVSWVTLTAASLRKLRDMKMILEWEVVKGQFL